jgi:type IV secretory pathway VirB9-like protein
MINHFFLAAILAAEPNTKARTVVYHDSDIIPLNVQVGYITEIHFPKKEVVMTQGAFAPHHGMGEFFSVGGNGNVLYIEPHDVPVVGGGLSTNVTVTLTSGNHVSFLVHEISKQKDAHADLKVKVEYEEAAMLAAEDTPQFVPVSQVASLQAENDRLRKETQQKTTEIAAKAVDSIKYNDYELYDQKGRVKWSPVVTHDQKFTYVAIDSQELPSIWEVKDGKSSKIEATFIDGKYEIPKLVMDGEIKVGKESIKFRRKVS